VTAALVLLALFGPAVLGALSRGTRRPLVLLLWQAALALLALGLFALAPVPDPAPPGPWTLPLAAGLMILFVFVVGPFSLRLPARLGLRGFERGIAALDRIPTPLLASAILVNGAAEEVLQRAVALPLLTGLTGSLGLAAVLTVLGAAAAHWPGWGTGPAVALVLSGAVLMAVYLASGDLWAMVLAHILIDIAGLLMPRLRRRA